MNKKIENTILLLLVSYSIYVASIVGMGWDELTHYKNGKNILNYILSFGNLEYRTLGLPFHFGFYDTLSHFIALNFTSKYHVFAHHITNLFFSIFAIFGISQLTRFLFNKELSKIIFIFSFINPIFFGHMAVNPKDTIITFAYIWISLLIFKYLKFQHIDSKRKRYTYLISIILALGLSIRLTFIGILIPIFLIFAIEIFFIKKNKINYKKFFYDLFLVFLISYTITIIFWPEMHSNFFTPYEIIKEYFIQFDKGYYGLYWGLLNGELFNIAQTPKSYLFINIFYKMPEFFILSIPLLIFCFFVDFKYFKFEFINFVKNFTYYLLFIFIPVLLIILLSIKVSVGLRYFLFIIPFLSIFPGLFFYYLYKRRFLLINKITLFIMCCFLIIYTINFFKITPYQYTYINSFNGKFSNNIKKFENDYWGLSIKELIKKFENNYEIDINKQYNFAFCGINNDIATYYLDKIDKLSYTKVHNNENYDFIIMTNLNNGNRLTKPINVKSCYEDFLGTDLYSVKRLGLKLSILRENNN